MEKPERDWKALERKLSRGFSLKDAATLCGVPLEEAQQYVTDSTTKQSELSFEVKKISERAFKKAIRHLEKLIDEGPRYAESTNQWGGSTTPINTDLIAAQTLAKMAMDSLKVSTGINPDVKPKPQAIQLDLFDTMGPWQGLKKPGS